MKALLVVASGLLAAAAVAGAHGVTKPGRARTEGAQIVALFVTGRSVTYAVADNASKSDCAHAYVWHTAGGATGKWRFGKPTNEPCVEGPSTGDGISAVAMSAERSLWIQYAGGNLRDSQLFTATRTKRNRDSSPSSNRTSTCPRRSSWARGWRPASPTRSMRT